MDATDVSMAQPGERPAIENLMQLYTHDFSTHWAGMARGDVDQTGRFAPYCLDPYWSDPSSIPLLFRKAGQIAGFALLNRVGHTGGGVDRNVAEFFVLRKYRRDGVGMTAAHVIFGRFPGVWEVAVTATNFAALDFWRRTLDSLRGISEWHEQIICSDDWNGPVLRFHVAG